MDGDQLVGVQLEIDDQTFRFFDDPESEDGTRLERMNSNNEPCSHDILASEAFIVTIDDKPASTEPSRIPEYTGMSPAAADWNAAVTQLEESMKRLGRETAQKTEEAVCQAMGKLKENVTLKRNHNRGD
jgi:hypothetical protein